MEYISIKPRNKGCRVGVSGLKGSSLERLSWYRVKPPCFHARCSLWTRAEHKYAPVKSKQDGSDGTFCLSVR